MKRLLTLLLLILPLTFGASRAQAEDMAVHLSEYHRTTWGALQGAPGDIGTIAQTRDGWPWVGTPRGLFRFDGVRFEQFVPSAGPRLQSSGISLLRAPCDGDLWIGYLAGGVSVLHDGLLRHVAVQVRDSLDGATASTLHAIRPRMVSTSAPPSAFPRGRGACGPAATRT